MRQVSFTLLIDPLVIIAPSLSPRSKKLHQMNQSKLETTLVNENKNSLESISKRKKRPPRYTRNLESGSYAQDAKGGGRIQNEIGKKGEA